MKNLIDDIQEFQNIILNDDQIIYNNQKIEDLNQSENNNIAKNEDTKNKNEENVKMSYSEFYKPILDTMAFRQNMQNKKEENKNSERPYKNYIIDNQKNKERKNNFNLEEVFGASSNAFNKTNYSTRYNKTKTKYPNSSNKNKNQLKLIEEFKDKYYGNKEYSGSFNLLNQNKIAVKLNNMHNLISERIDKDDRFHPNSYKNIINNIKKEIEIIRKERKKENVFFDKKIKELQKDFLNIESNNSRQKIKTIKNNYLKNKLKKSKTKNKRNFSNKGKTQNNFARSYNKSKISYNKSKINNNKSKTNYNNYKNIDYIIQRKISSLNKNKSLPKYFFKKKKNRFTKSQNKNKNLNPEQLFYQRIKNEIKTLDKENQKFEQKYKNIPLSIDQLSKTINDLIEKNNIAQKYSSNINLKNNGKIIKKNINLISNKIISDILLECIGELTNIERQRTEGAEKEKFKAKLNSVLINLEEYKKKEGNLLQEHKNKNIQKEEIKNKEIKLPPKIINLCEIDKDIINRCDMYQWKFLEHMLMKGSFYSDFNIFKIYEIFVEEMSKIIMEEEIDRIINKTDKIIDNICNDEINEIK